MYYLKSLMGLFDCDKDTPFFSLLQTPAQNSFSGILSICRVCGLCCSAFLEKNSAFGDKMLFGGDFCGKSFFRLFLLFSQSVKKN